MNFLDIKLKNNNGRYEFDVRRKPALTNVQIMPHSCIPPDTITSTFKGFLARTSKICSEKYLRVEIEYLTDIFRENGHDRETLQKMIKRKHVVLAIIIMTTTLTKSKQLPFLGYQKSDQKSNKEIQRFGSRVAFQTGPNLKNILCKNKDKLIPDSYPGVYELKCSCGSVYNGETKKKIISRPIDVGDKKASKVTGHPLEQPNTQGMSRPFRLVTPQISPHEI